jgi:hypothetical protein
VGQRHDVNYTGFVFDFNIAKVSVLVVWWMSGAPQQRNLLHVQRAQPTLA